MPRAFDTTPFAALYALGLTDMEIARRAGCTPVTVGRWRKNKGLPVQGGRVDWGPAWDLHAKGATDKDIAAAVGVDLSAVGPWRKRHGLAINRARPVLDQKRAASLHEAGHTDAQIADACGVSKSAVAHWRKRTGRAAVGGPSREARFDWDKGAALHAKGATDKDIAAALGCSKAAVGRWRRKTGLPINAAQKGGARRRSRAKPAPDRTPARPRRMALPDLAGLGSPRGARRADPVVRPEGFCADRDARLAATGGRYRDLAELAERWGMEFRRVQARFHVVAR